MHKATSNSFDSDACHLDTFSLITVEELNEFEAFTSIFVSVAQSVSGTISTGEKSGLISARNRMERAAFYLFNSFFGLEEVEILDQVFVVDVLS
jgi:hypothetical protein